MLDKPAAQTTVMTSRHHREFGLARLALGARLVVLPPGSTHTRRMYEVEGWASGTSAWLKFPAQLERERSGTEMVPVWKGEGGGVAGYCGAPFAHAAASRTAELLRPPTPHSLPIEVHDLETEQFSFRE
jgi:hypothetical protein